MKSTGKEVVKVENGPAAIGPYSSGIKLDGFVFTSGQLGLDASTGMIVPGGVEAETRQALVNVKAILESAHSSLNQVVLYRNISCEVSSAGGCITQEWNGRD
jgi:2-iminobutanoate/2-iminopropanoate deaminase